MSCVNIRGCCIGEGRPKVIIPIIEPTEAAILEKAAEFSTLRADGVEWRIDCFEGAKDLPAIVHCAAKLRVALKDKLLLFTFRTKAEGGKVALSHEEYLHFIRTVLATDCADLIDIEFFTAGAELPALIEEAHTAGAAVVCSSHDFHKTPPRAELVSRMVAKTGNPFAKAAAFLAAGAGETLNQQAGSFADWLRAALLVHPNGGPLRRLAGNLELPFVDTRSTLTLTVQADPLPPAGPRTEENAPPQPEADPALVKTLRQGFGWQYPAAALANIPAKVSVTSLVHAAERTTLERPGFLSKDGLTAAEMGTALHAFLEHADFAALAAVRGGEDAAVLDAVRTERERQVAAQLTPPAIAEKLDENKILRFVRSEAFDRICGAEEVLRELAFITSLPAAEVMAAQGRALPEGDSAADAGVLVQGIADIVLVYPDHLELLDYKTDRRKTPADFVRAYRAQLELYAKAIEKRFAPRRVTYKGIYSLELGELIQV